MIGWQCYTLLLKYVIEPGFTGFFAEIVIQDTEKAGWQEGGTLRPSPKSLLAATIYTVQTKQHRLIQAGQLLRIDTPE